MTDEELDDILGRGLGDPDMWKLPCYHDDFRVRPIKKYEDKYLVTANGKIFSKSRWEKAFGEHKRFRKGRWLSATGSKYKGVELTNGKGHSVHRLVAIAFIPNHGNKPFINHIDNNPSHNCAINLEWCTQSENIQHGTDFGNVSTGSDKPNAKLNWGIVAEIKQKLSEGCSLNLLAQEYGVSKRTILFVKQGKHWQDKHLRRHRERISNV